jgi:hypothetical protein
MNNELKHYGIKGMKWGVRRYQNPNGTYTKAGKERNAKKLRRAYETGGSAKLRKNKEFVKAADRVKKSRKALVDAVDNLDTVAFGIMNEKQSRVKADAWFEEQKKRLIKFEPQNEYEKSRFKDHYVDPRTGDVGTLHAFNKRNLMEVVVADPRYVDAANKRNIAEDAYKSACGDVVTSLVGRYGDESVRRRYYGSNVTVGSIFTGELYQTVLSDLYPSGRTNKRFDELYDEAFE